METQRDARRQKTAIRELFTRIAARYDRVNRLISLGQDHRWRKEALALTALPPEGTLLDVATGTGDVALLARQLYPGRRIVGVDLTPAMAALARQKGAGAEGNTRLHWSVGDGLALPFPDNACDAVISAFMLRNVPDVTQAFVEQTRVVRRGGRVVCLEMTWPRRFPMSWLFKGYFFGWAPLVGRALGGDREAYEYLPRSVRRFSSPETVAQQMKAVGLENVSWRLRMWGTVAIYVGQKE